ncbi:MAG: hypothetical protein CFH39_00373, partial [Alphaproteobacteria bacterium MarineAlpha10_Bin2]
LTSKSVYQIRPYKLMIQLYIYFTEAGLTYF